MGPYLEQLIGLLSLSTDNQPVWLPTFNGYGDLGIFLQRFETIVGHCIWPPEKLAFRMKQQTIEDVEFLLGHAIYITSIQEFVNKQKSDLMVALIRNATVLHWHNYEAELCR
jgi:hypothetical protein